MFLKNAWYVAAWSKDVGRDLLGRILLNEYVVLYRKEDGTPVALENRCPHRNLPLSEGRLIGDEIECGYHGMVYDCAGACTHLPGSAEPPDWATIADEWQIPTREGGTWHAREIEPPPPQIAEVSEDLEGEAEEESEAA